MTYENAWKLFFRFLSQTIYFMLAFPAIRKRDDGLMWLSVLIVFMAYKVNRIWWKLEDEDEKKP